VYFDQCVQLHEVLVQEQLLPQANYYPIYVITVGSATTEQVVYVGLRDTGANNTLRFRNGHRMGLVLNNPLFDGKMKRVYFGHCKVKVKVEDDGETKDYTDRTLTRAFTCPLENSVTAIHIADWTETFLISDWHASPPAHKSVNPATKLKLYNVSKKKFQPDAFMVTAIFPPPTINATCGLNECAHLAGHTIAEKNIGKLRDPGRIGEEPVPRRDGNLHQYLNEAEIDDFILFTEYLKTLALQESSSSNSH
jgi:hypothetical protein